MLRIGNECLDLGPHRLNDSGDGCLAVDAGQLSSKGLGEVAGRADAVVLRGVKAARSASVRGGQKTEVTFRARHFRYGLHFSSVSYKDSDSLPGCNNAGFCSCSPTAWRADSSSRTQFGFSLDHIRDAHLPKEF